MNIDTQTQSRFIASGNLAHVVYIDGGTGSTAGQGLYLKGHWVMKPTFESSFKNGLRLRDIVPVGGRFIVKNSWDAALWATFPSGQQKNIGRSFRFFADNGLLPFKVVNPDAKNQSLLYERIAEPAAVQS